MLLTNIRSFFSILSIFVALLPATSHASDYLSPRTAGLGGSGHAAPILNDTIYLNPSFGSFNPGYTLSMGYVNFDGMNYNLAVQDGRNEYLQAGVGYTRREDGKMFHLGASRSFINRLGFGLGAKFYFGKDDLASGQDVSLSASGIVSEWIQVSLLVDNLFETESGKRRNLYREFVLGSKLNIEKILLLYFDPQLIPGNDEGASFGHTAGLEIVVMRDFFLRFGNFRNVNVPWLNHHARGFSTGLGWVGPRFSADYAFTRIVGQYETSAHTFGFTMYF